VLKEERMGKVQTVLGLIDADSLGVSLPHEHLLKTTNSLLATPSEASEQELAYQPVNLENLNWVRHHYARNLDNLQLQDEQMMIDEAMFFKRAGGDTIVDLTCTSSSGRNPLGLTRLAQATGLNIIMSTGFFEPFTDYKASNIADRTEEDLADQIVREIMVGAADTGVRAGIIGEIGMAWPLSDIMRRVLRVSAHAQKHTGAALNIHLPLRASSNLPCQKDHEDVVMEVIQTLDKAGSDLNRTILSHVDICCFTPDFRRALAETGCYLEYDCFGVEGSLDEDFCVLDTPNDAQRINEIMQLIEQGYLTQILVSSDHWTKHMLRRYGGWGYDHILTSVVPLMRLKGMSDEQIHTLLVENPKRVLPFAPVKE
jgi:phosphotriesterase-related protein